MTSFTTVFIFTSLEQVKDFFVEVVACPLPLSITNPVWKEEHIWVLVLVLRLKVNKDFKKTVVSAGILHKVWKTYRKIKMLKLMLNQ